MEKKELFIHPLAKAKEKNPVKIANFLLGAHFLTGKRNPREQTRFISTV